MVQKLGRGCSSILQNDIGGGTLAYHRRTDLWISIKDLNVMFAPSNVTANIKTTRERHLFLFFFSCFWFSFLEPISTAATFSDFTMNSRKISREEKIFFSPRNNLCKWTDRFTCLSRTWRGKMETLLNWIQRISAFGWKTFKFEAFVEFNGKFLNSTCLIRKLSGLVTETSDNTKLFN